MNAKLEMILSMVIYGTLAPFVRRIPLSSAEVALFRAVIAMAVAQTVRLLRRRRGGAAPRLRLGGDVGLLLFSGAAMGLNWVFLFQAYRYTSVAVATLSYYFAPVIVMALCPLLFRERVTRLQVLCFAGSTAGLVLVVNAGGLQGGGQLRGVAFGLAAAALYATVILLNKRIRSVTGLDRTLVQFLAAAIVLLPYVCLTGGFHLGGMDTAGWANLLAVGLIHTGAAYCLYFSALRALPGQETAILSYIDPLVAVVLSVTVLGESVAPVQLLGGAMILAFTLVNELLAARA